MRRSGSGQDIGTARVSQPETSSRRGALRGASPFITTSAQRDGELREEGSETAGLANYFQNGGREWRPERAHSHDDDALSECTDHAGGHDAVVILAFKIRPGVLLRLAQVGTLGVDGNNTRIGRTRLVRRHRMDCVVRLMDGRWRFVRAAAVAALAFSAGACGSIVNMMPDPGNFRLPDRATFVPTRASVNYSISPTAPVGPADLVNGEGQCSAAPEATEASPRGVRLDMTECDVVHALGQPQSVDFTSQGGGDQRRITMTYKVGERPGIYEFTGGRLTGIERGEEPPPPAVAKKPPVKKPKPQPPA
jgi:hypothetical protein